MTKLEQDKTQKPDYLGHRKRVRQKFLKSTGEELQDYELLEILLFNVYPRKDTKAIAKNLLKHFQDLPSVINADIHRLRQIENIGESAIVALKINAQIISRILKIRASKKEVLSNWQLVLDYARSSLANLDNEVFRVLFLNKNYQLIEDELISLGESDFVQISVKNIAKKALILHASSVILMHNHPASNLQASKSDIKTTNEIVNILEKLEIDVIDHIIIGKQGYFSFKEEGIL